MDILVLDYINLTLLSDLIYNAITIYIVLDYINLTLLSDANLSGSPSFVGPRLYQSYTTLRQVEDWSDFTDSPRLYQSYTTLRPSCR